MHAHNCFDNPFLPCTPHKPLHQQAWAELDPRATNFIPAVQLGTLICELDPPLGVRGEEGVRAKLQSIIMSVDVPLHGSRVRTVGGSNVAL